MPVNEHTPHPEGNREPAVTATGRRFQVGCDEVYTILVESSLWTGLRTHAIDAAGVSTPVHRGACRFEVGERERHEVEIQVDRTASVNAFVDGELVEKNLFPRTRAVIVALVFVFSVLVFVLAYRLFDWIFSA